MDLLSVIRRWHFRQAMPIREIKRRTGLSRNTIRKYLRSDVVEPSFKIAARPSKLDPFADKLTAWLRVESKKSRKQKRTAKQLHGDLVKLGYDGSYGRVAAFARQWRRERQYEEQTSGRGTFVPLVFQPGEAFQFDWSEDYAVLDGKPTKLQVAHTKLAHSRAFIVRAYLIQTHEMLFDALTQAFRVLGGVPQRGIFNNMRTAVDRIGTGKARQVNARFAAMASHYLFETDFCNPASGWEKGQVEKNVQDARRRFWQPMPSFPDLAALNDWLEGQCIQQWTQIQHGVLPGTVADVHAAEAACLMPPGRPFDGFVEHTKRVTPTCLIAVLSGMIVVLDEQVKLLDQEIARRAKTDEVPCRLMTIPGIGPITATTLAALAPPPEVFGKGRDFAAWLGLTPLQKSTGGKQKLGATSKMGERTLRRLLIIGASSVVCQATRRGAPAGSWLARMLARKPRMLVITALANKMARTVWALMAKNEIYRAPVVAG